ncbi:protein DETOXIFICATION 16-like isoform X2 [Cicer arietinum]|uniref:Protein DETOXIFICATION 16-like isoform X2 n=1 Tax=Cicer arietinum TaxID=3827 RepID=A0A3Q7Y4B3_CICAR|nr:protein DETOXIFICATION 16-like isoform X2 [Cicer arietinum]
MGICKGEIREEVKKQLWLGVPLIFVNVLNSSLPMISLMFIGHLDDRVLLAGAALANSFMMAIGTAVLIGFASALETFCGQSYGAKKYHMVGIHLQRAILINMLFTIPQSLVMANLRPILIALHQDHNIATQAGIYGRYLIPNLIANGLLRCFVKFLQTQNIVFPMLLASGITSLLHFLNCWIWVVKLRHGIKGAAIAMCMSNWLYTILLALYIKFSSTCKSTWTGFSRESLHNMPQFLKIGIPSAIMLCLEIWMYEIMMLLSGLLPNPKLQTSVICICMNISSVVWMLSSGFTGAASIRVSNELGAGNPRAACLAVYVVLVLVTVDTILVGSVMILLRNIWGYAYTNEIEVVKFVASMFPLLVVVNFVDSLASVLSGIARGCGWQKIGAIINLGSGYIIGIPTAIVLGFVLHIGVKANKAKDRVYKSITPESLVS